MDEFEYAVLVDLPQEYFTSLCYRSDTSEPFHLGVLYAVGSAPPPSHPPAGGLTVALGELAEHITITDTVLACFTAASRIHNGPQQRSFLAGVYTALGVPVESPAGNTRPAGQCGHYVGTVDGKRACWRRDEPGGKVTWLYNSDDVAATNHIAIRVPPLNRVALLAYTRVAAKQVQVCEHTRAQIQLGGGQVLQALRVANNAIRRPVTVKRRPQGIVIEAIQVEAEHVRCTLA